MPASEKREERGEYVAGPRNCPVRIEQDGSHDYFEKER